jgi:hypothetical protein
MIDETEFWDLSVRTIDGHVDPMFWAILEKRSVSSQDCRFGASVDVTEARN